jgi:hypothetical protein
MKMIVETVGSIQCMGSLMAGGDAVPHNRPAVVEATTYIQMKAASGVIKILAQDVPDNANDAEFAGFWLSAKGDTELAVESYLASLPEVVLAIEEPIAPEPKQPKFKPAKA